IHEKIETSGTLLLKFILAGGAVMLTPNSFRLQIPQHPDRLYLAAPEQMCYMPVFTDQTGRKVEINNPPRRIVSLVPSQTELLYDLGLEQEVMGITKFCVHPETWLGTKTKVGGTKDIKMDIIQGLNPDLIIANKE